MNDSEYQSLNERLIALHYNLPVSAPDKYTNHRTTVLDAMRELTLAHLRDDGIKKLLDELTTLRTASKAQKHLIADLEQKLNGLPVTKATGAAHEEEGE